MSTPDWPAVRARFRAPRHGVYLNTASYGPGPDTALEALATATTGWSEGRGDWAEWEQAGERARAGLASLLSTRADRVALIPTVSLGAAQVARSFEGRGDANVVVGRDEFRSNLFPWMALGERGLEVRLVPFRDNGLNPEDVVERIDGKTAVVALSHVQSANGWRIDLEPIAEACRRHGAKLFVDATQSAGAVDFDLGLCDWMACSGYKWLLAPRGTAYLVCSHDEAASIPPLAPGWKTPSEPYGDYYGPPYDPPANGTRYDQALAWPAWVGAPAGLELIGELGIAQVEAHNLDLARSFREGARALGYPVLFGDAHPSPIAALEVENPAGLKRALEAEDIRAAVRDRFLRVAFHLYNDAEDVAAVLDVLGRLRKP